MRYLKAYEDINGPKKGDYVIMRSRFDNPELTKFIENTIGRIYIIYYNHTETTNTIDDKDLDICVIYDWIPIEIRDHNFRPAPAPNIFSKQGGYTCFFKKNYILEYGKTIDDLNLKISVKKYNI